MLECQSPPQKESSQISSPGMRFDGGRRKSTRGGDPALTLRLRGSRPFLQRCAVCFLGIAWGPVAANICDQDPSSGKSRVLSAGCWHHFLARSEPPVGQLCHGLSLSLCSDGQLQGPEVNKVAYFKGFCIFQKLFQVGLSASQLNAK